LGTIFKRLDSLISETQRTRQGCDTGAHAGNESDAMQPPAPGTVLVTAVPAEQALYCDERLSPEEFFHGVFVENHPLYDPSGELHPRNEMAQAMVPAHTSASGGLPRTPHAVPVPRTEAMSVATAPSPAHHGVALRVGGELAERMWAVDGQNNQAHAAPYAFSLSPVRPQLVGAPQGTSPAGASAPLSGVAPPATTPATTSAALVASKRPRGADGSTQAQGTYAVVLDAISNPDLHAFERTGEVFAAVRDFSRAKLQDDPTLVPEQIAELTAIMQVLDSSLSKREGLPQDRSMQFRSLTSEEDGPALRGSCWSSLSMPSEPSAHRSLSPEG